ncbi:transposase [Pseudomonas argentinensis]|uniref:REP element-mobilizing transposase RayT n=1 Tax=Phytopseudomonas argentinensis TaxID=289370 RepID=A0A1I3GTH7_9GAMM|nr:transposase [Pseudomonas argentinensis]KAB0548903.1 transposase [Pseudomonas argentinensis]SFI26693.1 REP element-mobilizing transposase RayT [Pseudomonas argentinensis]
MPHSVSLRKGRISLTNHIYLLTATVENRQAIFADLTPARLLIRELYNAQASGLAESLAWVVMPDHLHWLVSLRQGSLSELMHRVKGRSALQVNSRLGRRGRLWQEGFHDRALRREEDILPTARYIVANPLRAGLVKRVGDYPFWDAMWL